MIKHTILLAEEKSSIARLVKKAIETKPMGQEKIHSIQSATDDNTLFQTLQEGEAPVAVILLSTTFSDSSHQSLIERIAEIQPSAKVISLSHRYGDRSTLEYGAFESVDKPIRNPVLWSLLDRALEAIEMEMEEALDEESANDYGETEGLPEMSFTFGDEKEDEKTEEQAIEVNMEPEKMLGNRESQSLLVVSDDDDLFGSPTPVKPTIQKEAVERTEEMEPIAKRAQNALRPENGIVAPEPAVELNIPSNEELVLEISPVETLMVNNKEATAAGKEEEELHFSFSDEVVEPPVETEPEWVVDDTASSVDTYNAVGKEIVLVTETIKDETSASVVLTEVPKFAFGEETDTGFTAPTALEPEPEIIEESPAYNELSEWTMAHEGFTTTNGEFVPLAPPRQPKNVNSTAKRNGVKGTSPNDVNAVSKDSDGRFGSVMSIFKKKQNNFKGGI